MTHQQRIRRIELQVIRLTAQIGAINQAYRFYAGKQFGYMYAGDKFWVVQRLRRQIARRNAFIQVLKTLELPLAA